MGRVRSPNGPVAKPCVLLRTALARSRKVAVAKVGFRGRECLALLRTLGDVLLFHAMRWPDEIRSPSGARSRTPRSTRASPAHLLARPVHRSCPVRPTTLHSHSRVRPSRPALSRTSLPGRADDRYEPSGRSSWRVPRWLDWSVTSRSAPVEGVAVAH
ncbi:Ku protein [Streptomyces sp. NPDC029003]|uniref:Ku protein n=1 Tax=Streptomyces sp. NPDC029003 TaxID=3155125 RepID=UPI0033CE26D1